MRVSPMRALRHVVGTIGELLITLGLLLLLFVAWQLWWTDVTAGREQAVAVQALERGFADDPVLVPEPKPEPSATPNPKPEPVATLKRVQPGKPFAILRIPRFGAGFAVPVLEGTDKDTLTKGVGHYVGTALPGVVGNFAVAGHRTTYGRPFHNIDQLRKGDFLVVETKVSYSVYAVDRYVIVTPDKVEVIAPAPQRPGVTPRETWMTLTACHPKFSAEKRYVSFARLVTTIPRASGLPASFLAAPKKAAA